MNPDRFTDKTKKAVNVSVTELQGLRADVERLKRENIRLKDQLSGVKLGPSATVLELIPMTPIVEKVVNLAKPAPTTCQKCKADQERRDRRPAPFQKAAQVVSKPKTVTSPEVRESLVAKGFVVPKK